MVAVTAKEDVPEDSGSPTDAAEKDLMEQALGGLAGDKAAHVYAVSIWVPFKEGYRVI